MRAPRIEPRPEFTTHSWSGLMTMCTSSPFWLTTLYIEGAYQASVSAGCCWPRSVLNLFWSAAMPPCLLVGHV